MSNYIGTKEITKIYLGSTEIKKLYVGEEPIWDGGDEGGGIDENTILMLHCDNNLDDSSQYASSLNTTGSTDYIYADGKFGKQIIGISSGSTTVFRNSQTSSVTSEATMDYWIYYSSTTTMPIAPRLVTGYGDNVYFLLWSGNFGLEANLYLNNNTIALTSYIGTLEANSWVHVALTIKSQDYIKIYINGHLIYTHTQSMNMSTYGLDCVQLVGAYQTSGGSIDEIRISKTIRYTGDFTPPTQPYGN